MSMKSVSSYQDLLEILDDKGTLKDAVIASNKLLKDCADIKAMHNVEIKDETFMGNLVNVESVRNVTIHKGVRLEDLSNLGNLDFTFLGRCVVTGLASITNMNNIEIPEGVKLHGFSDIKKMRKVRIKGSVYYHGTVMSMKDVSILGPGELYRITSSTMNI